MFKSLLKFYTSRTNQTYWLLKKPMKPPWFKTFTPKPVSRVIPLYRNILVMCRTRIKFSSCVGVIFSSTFVAYCYASNGIDKSEEFFYAVSVGNTEHVKRLLDDGFDVNSKHAFGWNPIHSAASRGDNRMVKLLLESGADPNVTDDFSTSFKIASRSRVRILEVITSRNDCFPRLSERQNFIGFTALHYAALSDDFETIQLLLNAGADPTVADSTGHYAHEYTGRESNANFIHSSMQTFNERQKTLEAEERRKYPLEQRFKEVIIGQEGAINAVASAVRRRENGWYDEEHPLVFLFLGSSGIGKTELAKQLAKYLHKDIRKGFIRLDMSEYQGQHEVAKLIGSPPGYIGHDQGGQLTKKLKEFPKAVVLFDEVDKAHPDVLTCLLQLFDEGRLTDGTGKTIDCKDAIFVMTSNLASEDIAQHALELRQQAKETTKQKQKSCSENTVEEDVTISRKFKEAIVYPILKSHFQRDEFLGRITEFVYFLPFSKTELNLLVEKELQFWATRADKKHEIELSWDSDILSILADGYNVHYGARSIKHEVERRVVNQIATAHERDMIKKNSKIHLVADYPKTTDNDNSFVAKFQRPTVKLQLIDEKENKQDIVLNNIYDPDVPIYF